MPCEYNIENNSPEDMTQLSDIIDYFMPYSQQQLEWREPVSLFLQSDEENANKILGKTAFYDPQGFSITLFVDGRHPKDILRSLSHELVHHTQNCRGEFENGCAAEEGYAQKDPHMRDMELEAYEKGNIIFRDFEDLIKTGKINIHISEDSGMTLNEWRNNELNRLLTDKWVTPRSKNTRGDGLAPHAAVKTRNTENLVSKRAPAKLVDYSATNQLIDRMNKKLTEGKE